MYTKILIPLDGSKTAEQVLPYARLLTSRFRKPVELIALIDNEGMASEGFDIDCPAYGSPFEQIVRYGEEYLQSVAASFDDPAVAWAVRKGPAAEGIIRRGETDPGMLIAMSTHGRSGVHRWLLGSVAEKVLRATVNPLLIIRADEEASPEKEVLLRSIVVPLDGSALAESVLPFAAGMAKSLDIPLNLLRAYELPVTAFMFGHGYYALDMKPFMEVVEEQAREYLENKAAEVRELGLERVSCIVREGLGADQIIKFAAEAADRLIVLSSHGRSGVRRWVLGSVTETVVRHTKNPVLVLRAK